MSLTAHQLLVRHGHHCLLDVPHLALQAGQVHAVLGPNGAGKSTLLHALCGLSAHSAKRVHLHQRPLCDWPALALARQRALLSQALQVPFDFSVRDIVGMGRHPHAECPHPQEATLIDQALHTTGALHLIDRLYAGLSGGEKARVQLARVLAQITPLPSSQTPCWLLLDEPTAALDLAHQHAVMGLLRDLAWQGHGVVVVVHDLHLAQTYADQAIVMREGRIDAQGPSAQVLQPGLIQRIWGVRCELLPRPGHEAGWLVMSAL